MFAPTIRQVMDVCEDDGSNPAAETADKSSKKTVGIS
jgi:hypothetical protein